ncbi:hypothetical protein HL658_13090 [Azospirillum sp. RWY-5-1]|uniref:J domain-containing protein n=1 Tax=Azospirillum oleiclasticum TaxID=2735135 RepID=A0ABX2TA08_9PROT|nr:hypothetical protein [Azospirillum oleiclasticum]NYZ13489.1 hypothetical protein [Azospirillum oleiclasticum]NYZ20650.1 hypothetical protein [Azospirillum oleiclasticum]
MTAPDGFSFDPLPGAAEGVAFPGASVSAGTALPGATVQQPVPCDPGFARRVAELAARRGGTPTAIASAALLLGSAAAEDPGPGPGVLVLHLPRREDPAAVRRALAAALDLAEGATVPAAQADRLRNRVETLEYRAKSLANALERVSFRPLDGGVREVRDAAQIFGFGNEWCFDEDRVVRRFRELAPVYHPDTGVVACRERMAQLIEARNLLIRHVRVAYRAGAWRHRG